MNIQWLDQVLEKIEEAESSKIQDREALGLTEIDDSVAPYYAASLVTGNYTTKIEFCVLPEDKKVILFLPYVHDDDCDNYLEDLKRVVIRDREFIMLRRDEDLRRTYCDGFVEAKCYRFYKSGKIADCQVGLRNDYAGYMYEGKYGKYILMDGTSK